MHRDTQTMVSTLLGYGKTVPIVTRVVGINSVFSTR